MRPAFIVLILAAALVSACATATPYAPADRPGGYGFSEQRLEANRLKVTVRGNSLTTREAVEDQLLFRAAETTLANGFDHFVVTSRATDADRRTVSLGPPRFGARGFAPEFWYYHRGFGWRSAYDPFWSDLETREVVRFEASAEIVMFKGAKPADRADAFDARDVSASLAPRIQRPAPEGPNR